jgi:hypothetical protein
LKSLRLISCDGTSQVLEEAVKKLPLLEELELSKSVFYGNGRDTRAAVLEAVARSCPRLKHLRHIQHKGSTRHHRGGDDEVALAIAGMSMTQFRSLELHHADYLTNTGLAAILRSCTRLELLITRNCPNVTVDGGLLAMAVRAGVDVVTLRADDDQHARYEATRGQHYYNQNQDDRYSPCAARSGIYIISVLRMCLFRDICISRYYI